MTQTAINYAKVLYELNISKKIIDDSQEIVSSVPELKATLISPVVSNLKKHNIIEKVFPKEMHNFFMVLCDYQSMEVIDQIFVAYKNYYNEQNSILEAKLIYVTVPNEEQLNNIKEILMKKHHKNQIELSLIEDPSIIGGFKIEADIKTGKIISDAEKTIRIEREKALREMQSEIAGLAMIAATKVVSNNSSNNINQSLYNDFLKKAGDSNDTNSN